MLFSSIGFFIIVGISVIAVGGGIYWFMHKKKEILFNISGAVAAVAAFAVWFVFITLKTSIIVIEAERTVNYSMLGSAEFEFNDGTKQKIPKLEIGEVIINNSVDSCVIIRADYTHDISDANQELLDIMFAVNPYDIFSLHGNFINYSFTPSPEYIEVKKRASYAVVKYELQYLTPERWETYYLYDGPIVNGVPNGYGKFYFSPTSYYEGDLVNTKFEGKGKLIYEASDWYEGEWSNDLKSGFGTYHYSDSSVYEGEWLLDEKEGEGIQKYYNGDVYEGEYSNGLKSGDGTYYYSDGVVYEGEWLLGKKEGYGVQKYDNGDVYKGDYVNGASEGIGKYTFASGSYYEGEFEDGNFQGQGKMYYSSTENYDEGIWFEDEYIGD